MIMEVRDYKEKFDLDSVLAEAVRTAMRSGATNPYEAIAGYLRDVKVPAAAAGDTDNNTMNDAMHAMGVLKHDPPDFHYFNPTENEQRPVHIKEVKLPHATETHEICYEPVSRCVFVSQMSNSVLVRIPVSSTSGLLVDDQDAWRVGEANGEGEGIGGLHNISLSMRHPGCLWLSLQFANTLILIEGATLKVREIVRVPTFLEVEGGPAKRIGGPHAIRECPLSGDIWVALKGAVSCHPAPPDEQENAKSRTGAGAKRLQQAIERTCCSSASLKEYMAAMDARGYDCPPPDGWAVWRLSPGKYDAEAADRGGVLYPCLGSPPMVAIDHAGNCWVAQDQNPELLRIDAKTGACHQFPVTFPAGTTLKITGPAVGVAPNGDVWCTLLGTNNALLRVNARTKKTAIYELGGPDWAKTLRLIHMDFATVDGRNQLFLLASDLLDEDGVNAVVIVLFDDKWEKILARRVVPLPTQDCSCHRVAVLQTGLKPHHVSIVVTEMASSKIVQIMLQNLSVTTRVEEKVDKLGDQDHYTYTDVAEGAGNRC